MRWVFSVCMILLGCTPRGEMTTPTQMPIREAQAAPPAEATPPVATPRGGYIEPEPDDNGILFAADDDDRGRLDKDTIRTVVRSHMSEVRNCYGAGLAKDPSLHGRVEIQFTIGPSGAVTQAVVAKADIASAEVPTCIADATNRWTFPKPQGGGNVVVTYPFILEPG